MIDFLRKVFKRKTGNLERNYYALREFPTIITGSQSGEEKELTEDVCIAVQVHVYFIELLDEMLEAVNNIEYPFDCYVSTDTEEKRQIIEEKFIPFCNAENSVVEVLENRGRDVAPFIQQIAPVIKQYKYIGHIHTKRSLHTDFGEDWRKFLLKNLFGSREYVNGIFHMFEKEKELGFIMPDVYPVIKEYVKWDGAKDSVHEMLEKMGLNVELPDEPVFSTGNMFWARRKAIEPLFELNYSVNDFPEEQGQLSLTLAHSIERLWVYLMKAQGYTYKICVNVGDEREEDEKCSNRLIVCENDEMVKEMQRYGKVFEGNWKDLSPCLFKQYEQIVFVDDTCIGPFDCLYHIFEAMNERNIDMWSILSEPIFFFVINKSVIESGALENAWENVTEVQLDKACYELHSLLLSEGFAFETYVHESEYISKWVKNKEPQIEMAYEYLLLGSPFLKKESIDLLDSMETQRVNTYLSQLPGKERIHGLHEEIS